MSEGPFFVQTDGLREFSQRHGDIAGALTQFITGAPGMSGVEASHGPIAYSVQTALNDLLGARQGSLQATAASGDKLAELLQQAARAYDQGDEKAAGRLQSTMDGASPGSAAAATPASAAGGAAGALGQAMGQLGQMGQMGQQAAGPLQALAQPLQQLPQQVMQGVQQIVESATQAGQSAGDAGGLGQAADGAGPGQPGEESRLGESTDAAAQAEDEKRDRAQPGDEAAGQAPTQSDEGRMKAKPEGPAVSPRQM